MQNKLWNNFKMFLWLTLLTGIAYPLFITGIAQLIMERQAEGSCIFVNGKIIGSKLISQKFESDKYFWPRPSAVDYNPLPSGGSNLGPTSALLKKTVEERKEKIAKAHHVEASQVPSELLFASGSGLDPHISPEIVYFQIERVIKARGLDSDSGKKALDDLIKRMTIPRALGFLGEPCVNVLLLNKALDELPNVRSP